ncbi:Glycosyl transferase family 2 [Cognatiyoonia sediminum]|uniref:Glycosyl transferase family 2 n=1 Tax=Cognatiyoonia sediminum TaxID=1508389 RepID=A0A1M5QUQ0_9RHOB|nr:glycosyltransferase family 2 protein [Cognatiyoonia sediminum]SHH17596.1 Glycosyl transferase family 2 [Cognatiyoonia sediminum]
MAEQETFLIVTTMKNEGPFMLDWVAYNRSIGFDDILIYTNDCSDGTDLIGDRLQALGFAHHERNRLGPRATPQNRAHSLSMKHPSFHAGDWVMSLDVDEYINVRLPSGSIRELVDASGPSDAISIAWKMFGHGGIDDFEDKPVPELFLQSTGEHQFPHYKTRAFKTLFRNNGKFHRYKAHRPRINPDEAPNPEAPYEGVVWRDAAGQTTQAADVDWKIWRGFGHRFARVHHYAVRTTDSFLVKRDRGRTNHVGQDQGLEYWQQLNHNHERDDSILRHMSGMQAVKDEMMADTTLRKLHEDACDWHRAKAAELKARPEWSDFVATLYGSKEKAQAL